MTFIKYYFKFGGVFVLKPIQTIRMEPKLILLKMGLTLNFFSKKFGEVRIEPHSQSDKLGLHPHCKVSLSNSCYHL